MRLGLSLALSSAMTAAVAPAAPFTSVNTNGWSAEYPTTPPTFTPDTSPTTFTVNRQGYDTSGNATTRSETLIIHSRVRQVYPNQASLTATTVALSDYIYSTDTISGVTNNSLEVSPQVIAAWGTVDRQLVGNSIDVEVIAAHRNFSAGAPIACVIFTATDGTNTVTQTVAAMTKSARTGDAAQVLCYAATLNITSLNDNANITVNAKCYPWVGTSTAIADSSLNTAGTRSFCPQVYRKNTSRFAAPPIVVISSTGNDGTAVVSTTRATAEASPALTLNGAWAAARAQLGATAGSLDGLRIEGGNGTWELTASPTANTTNCDVVYTRNAALATRAQCIFGFGTANLTQGATYMRATDCTVKRSGAFSFTMPTGGFSTFKDVTFDANSQASTQYWTQNHRIDGGVTVTNPSTGGNLFSAGTHTLMSCRGLTYGSANTNWQVDAFRVFGCDLSGVSMAYGTRSATGAMVCFNKFSKMGNASGDQFTIGQAADVSNYARIQNVVEWTSASVTQTVGYSRDTGTGNLTHIIDWHNTHTGFGSCGRHNIFYDETVGTNRNHKLVSFVGAIASQINIKGDVYATDGTKIGHFPNIYGVGWSGVFTQFIDANSGGLGASFAPVYPGRGANFGTSITVRNDPLFTNYQGTTSGPTAGAGGGTYTLSTSSPAKTIVPVSPLPFDLAGTARTTTGATAGAYQA